MPKQNYGIGLEKNGPHRQGEKGGQGGMDKKRGMSEYGGNRTPDRSIDYERKNKSNLIGKRHIDIEREGKF